MNTQKAEFIIIVLIIKLFYLYMMVSVTCIVKDRLYTK